MAHFALCDVRVVVAKAGKRDAADRERCMGRLFQVSTDRQFGFLVTRLVDNFAPEPHQWPCVWTTLLPQPVSLTSSRQ
jgi:hypothetical protein